MVTAVVLLNAVRDRINDVAEELADFKGITEVFTVTGRYDLVAVIRVPSGDMLADLVTRQLLKVEGITKSETLYALKAYSRHDLESMFDIAL